MEELAKRSTNEPTKVQKVQKEAKALGWERR